MPGPVLLLLATSLLLGDPQHSVSEGPDSHYFGVSRDFFVLLALVEGRPFGIDLTQGGGITASSGWNLAANVVFAAMAGSSNRRQHEAGTLLTWMQLALPLLRRGIGGQSR